MRQPFIVISGLPGSGKSTLARQLAPLLNLSVIDKDDILEELFDAKGTGDVTWRRALSRESDLIFQHRATTSSGALLVSFWHLRGMPRDSGTPTSWLATLSDRLVCIHCHCKPEVAAKRFFERKRHPGHLDREATDASTLAGIQAIAHLAPLQIGRLVEVDTSGEVRLDVVFQQVEAALNERSPVS